VSAPQSQSKGQKKGEARAQALAVSLAFHLLFFAGLVAGISRSLLPSEAPPMQVELYTPNLELRQREASPRFQPDSRLARPETLTPLPSPIPEALRPQGPTNRPRPIGPIQNRPLAEVTPFYRDHIDGCGKEDLALMDPEEREKCQVRITAKAVMDEGRMRAEDRNARPILRLDPDKRELFAKEARNRRGRDAVDPLKPCEGSTIGLGPACLNKDAKPN
jgi:hypothetical protein